MDKNYFETKIKLQNNAENSLNEFFKSHTGIDKKFKIFSINYDKSRILITFSSRKKDNTFIEIGIVVRNYGGKI